MRILFTLVFLVIALYGYAMVLYMLVADGGTVSRTAYLALAMAATALARLEAKND